MAKIVGKRMARSRKSRADARAAVEERDRCRRGALASAVASTMLEGGVEFAFTCSPTITQASRSEPASRAAAASARPISSYCGIVRIDKHVRPSDACGTISRSSSSRFAARVPAIMVITPVTLPPGRAEARDKADARPGRSPTMKTIGIVVVAALAAERGRCCRFADDHGYLTVVPIRPPALATDRTDPRAQRYSIATLRAFDIARLCASPCVNAVPNSSRRSSGDPRSRNPITGIAGCCARAASGHAAAAPPSSVMNSRRCSGRDVHFMARPPPRSVRAAFPHTAPASGV